MVARHRVVAEAWTEETKLGNELGHKYHGPEWDGKKESYTEWRWEATPYLDALGLESVRRGRNRGVLTTNARSKEAVTMVIALNKLFRVILRMIKRVGTEAAALLSSGPHTSPFTFFLSVYTAAVFTRLGGVFAFVRHA